MTHPHSEAPPLPPGQKARSDFPRFGLAPYARRFPRDEKARVLTLSGDALESVTISSALEGLERVEQVSDFHCVTTWSHRALHWGGVRFSDFYGLHIAPRVDPAIGVRWVVLRGQDGYQSRMLLADLLANDVLLADTLDGLPLTLGHGAPLRLVAPAHYGYKSVKHLSHIECWQAEPKSVQSTFAFMNHPRGRVALEERAQWMPGWLLRHVYRPMIKPNAALFANAAAEHAGTRPDTTGDSHAH
ncbi:MAG TPA: molybdopterin-dependent oxidoreductase [Polaromonas sp.]|uniref:molybdopterin-dependent oxidoreductase n=1 Tax=Polaromonas sp. TaxID=1869339 RepID=UPI002D6DDA30|nr:molybdopterin-dependent oxidoreductase [Polaromonas sp.]HYW55444.1 molybdopterin-dependent oxidoreductase [Polaromonas sp.]